MKWWFTTLNEEQRSAFGSASYYHCPSRRGGGSHYVKGVEADFTPSGGLGNNGGPQGDYAIPLVYDFQIPSATCWWHTFKYNASDWEPHRGPIRTAATTDPNGTDPKYWTPRDTFAWISDGTSNQFLLGEKHIPADRIGKCTKTVGYTDDEHFANVGDCTMLVTGEWPGLAAMRLMVEYNASGNPTRRPITRPDEFPEDNRNAKNNYSFGGTHPAGCLFLLADGSVHTVAVTIHPTILEAYAHVSDGKSLSLP